MSASRAHSLSGQTLNDMVVKISRAHNPIIKAPKVRRARSSRLRVVAATRLLLPARVVADADSGGPQVEVKLDQEDVDRAMERVKELQRKLEKKLTSGEPVTEPEPPKPSAPVEVKVTISLSLFPFHMSSAWWLLVRSAAAGL